MNIKTILTWLILIIILVVSLRLEIFLRLPGNFSTVLENSGYFYVFDIEEFKGQLYAFLSSETCRECKDSAVASAKIMIFYKDKNIFQTFSNIKMQDRETYIRNTYNDSNKRLFLVTSRRSASGEIYLTEDLKTFKKVYSSNKFVIRSLSKFKGTYIAGTDGGGFILASKDGENWNILTQSNLFGQTNEIIFFKDKIYFVDNGGIITTNDLKKFKRVFKTQKDNAQLYAVWPGKKYLYIGSGWRWDDKTLGNGNLFLTEDGKEFKHLIKITESPMPYFIIPVSQSEDEILWGGYGNRGIFYINFKKGMSRLVFNLPKGEVPYTVKLFNGKIYIGTYGPGEIISYNVENNQ